MSIKTKDIDLTLDTKALKDDGTFEGYGSVFDNVDSYGEIVKKGAFADTLKKNGGSVVMLFNHDRDQPIGQWEGLKEDSKGLFGKGVLDLNVQRAKEIYSLLKSGAIKGLSIGYRLLKWEIDPDDKNILLLTGIDLKEISAVVFPANTAATVTDVKAAVAFSEVVEAIKAGKPLPIKAFEDALRDVGFSRSQATAVASRGYKAVQGEPEGKSASDVLSEMLTKLKVTA